MSRQYVSDTDAIVDRKVLLDTLQSQVAWLGMLGDLSRAVRERDWEKAGKLAERRITYPQPYPEADD